jgi:hypothetical protein
VNRHVLLPLKHVLNTPPQRRWPTDKDAHIRQERPPFHIMQKTHAAAVSTKHTEKKDWLGRDLPTRGRALAGTAAFSQ